MFSETSLKDSWIKKSERSPISSISEESKPQLFSGGAEEISASQANSISDVSPLKRSASVLSSLSPTSGPMRCE